jgi:hypothetical protein
MGPGGVLLRALGSSKEDLLQERQRQFKSGLTIGAVILIDRGLLENAA